MKTSAGSHESSDRPSGAPADETLPDAKLTYVGADACRECHTQRVDVFLTTSHFRTSRLPQVDELARWLTDGKAIYQTRNPQLLFEVEQQGSGFVQTVVQKTDSGEHRQSEQLSLVFGTGKADVIFHYWRQNELYQSPMAYLNPLGQWGNPPGYMDGVAKTSRPIPARCLECHTTYFEHLPGTANVYDRSNFILGITCERCHGEGSRHVAYHRSHPGEQAAHFIVHPGELARDRQLDVCSQCHGNASKRRTAAFSYRPGEPLESHFRIDKNQYPENDHAANQLRYLRESKCFQADVSLTCTTCHDPHTPEGPRNSGSIAKSCGQCHQPEHCGRRGNLPNEIRDNCFDCHMPQRPIVNITFDTATDQYVSLIQRHEHRIAIYPDATQQTLLAWYRTQSGQASADEASRLSRELAEQRLREAAAFEQQHRFMSAIGAYREALQFDPADETQRALSEVLNLQRKLDLEMPHAQAQIEAQEFDAAMNTLREVLRLKPDHALAHGKLGMLLANAGQTNLAIGHLETVGKADPDSPYGDALLGWIYYLRRDFTKSIDFYRQAIDKEPYDAKLNFHIGLALADAGQLNEAMEHLQKSLEIQPDHVDACQTLCRVQRERGLTDEAVRSGERAAKMSNFENPVVLATLADAYADAGRLNDAVTTAQRALMLAQAGKRQLVPQIRARLDTYERRVRDK